MLVRPAQVSLVLYRDTMSHNLLFGKGLCSLAKPDMFLSDPRMACYLCADEGVSCGEGICGQARILA